MLFYVYYLNSLILKFNIELNIKTITPSDSFFQVLMLGPGPATEAHRTRSTKPARVLDIAQ